MKCGVSSAECEAWSVECGVRSVECEVRSVEPGAWSDQWKVEAEKQKSEKVESGKLEK